MLLTTAVLLGLISATLEIYLVRKSRAVNWLLRRAGWVPIVFSMTLSVVLGTVFGAAGVIVMFAGVLSTVIVQPYYWLTSPKTKEKLVVNKELVKVKTKDVSTKVGKAALNGTATTAKWAYRKMRERR